jgi:3-deoxy-manno-octulosonate cytidylyltransferase (CMP-KDO synthetase)
MQSDKKVIAVIPARMGSSRFPGKPLTKILDFPLVEHVRRRALLSENIDDVIVATCDLEIKQMIENYGGKAVMTADTHERCTDRVEEAMKHLNADIVVIVQGDEPLFFPEVLEELVQPMLVDESIYCTNLLSNIYDESDLQDVDIVKASINKQQKLMFYSRSPIPHIRVRKKCPLYRQTGISAFSKSFLCQFTALEETPMEVVESIDFLRILEHGFDIQGVVYDQLTIGVDQPDDVEKVTDILLNDPKQNEYFQRIKNQ